jgi:methylated-DNA-protein-cysteine methyltransferase-like protein
MAAKNTKKNRKQDFFDRVFKVVAKIPKGKVTTYGAIAEVCGIKSAARTVGWALNGSFGNLPCHRVVNRNGVLTGKIHFGDPNLMEELLRSEGVEFDKDGCVIMEKFFWHPPGTKRTFPKNKKINNVLPSKKRLHR